MKPKLLLRVLGSYSDYDSSRRCAASNRFLAVANSAIRGLVDSRAWRGGNAHGTDEYTVRTEEHRSYEYAPTSASTKPTCTA